MANTAAQITDIVWRQYETMLNDGTISEIVITGGIANTIGRQGINTIALRYRNVLETSVVISPDASHNNSLRIRPAHDPMGNMEIIPKKLEPKNGVSKKDKLPRPPNAFILYRQHHHPLIKAKNPTFHNNQISIILGKQWKAEDEVTKTNFKLMAESLKEKHFLEHPEYQYQPRKPTEKKRRMTRRKAEALSVGAGPTFDEPAEISSKSEATFEAEESSITLPEFDTTFADNIVFDLGDEDLKDETFAAMLEDFNSTVSPNLAVQDPLPSILFTEPTEGAQNDFNFYSSMLDLNDDFPGLEFPYAGDPEVDEAIDTLFRKEDQWSKLNPEQQGKIYDVQQRLLTYAELERTKAGL